MLGRRQLRAAAAMLRVSRVTVYRLFAEGKLHIRVSNAVCVAGEDIESFLSHPIRLEMPRLRDLREGLDADGLKQPLICAVHPARALRGRSCSRNPTPFRRFQLKNAVQRR